MKRNYKLSLLLIFLFLSPFSRAQKDLQFYLNSAFKNNPSLRESENNIKVKSLDKSLSEAQYILPQISLTANYLIVPYFNNDKIVTVNPGPKAVGYDASITNGGLYSAQVNVSKNIFNGGVVDVFNNQADLQIKSNQYNYELTKHNLEKDVIDQYITCWQDQELYKLSTSIADTLKQQLKISQNLMMKGLVKQSDYLLLKIEFENQQLAGLQALTSLKSAVYHLNTLSGIQDTSVISLETVNLNKSELIGSSKFFTQYENDSLLILNQQDVFETKYYPQFNLFFNAGLNAVDFNDIQRKFGVSAGFNFSLPLYDGSQKNITRQQSLINLNTIVSNRKNQETLLKNKIKESLTQLDYNSNFLQSIDLQLNDYNKIIDLLNSELMHGQLSMVDYITIIKNYIDLKKNAISSSTAYQLAVNQFNYWNW